MASSCEVPHEQRNDLVGVDERAVAVNRPDAVAIAVGAEAGVVFSGTHGSPQRFDVRLDRLRIYTAETRITRPAYFVAANSVATEELRQQARRRSVHGIEDEAEFRIAQALPVHQFFERIEIRRGWFESVDQIFAC